MQLKTDRQYFIDWLRVGSMFLLIFYHSGRLFDEPGWHLKNAVGNQGIHIFNRVLDLWQMPMFFLVAGAAVWFSMSSRGAGTFAKERVSRLLVPLIFGMLVLVPPQVYLERIFDGDFTGSFWAWWPHTFQPYYSNGDASTGNLSWHHLWFLAYLFVFSMLLIPVFRYFRREDKKPIIEKIAGFFSKPGAIFLPAIPLIIIDLLLRDKFGSGNQNLFNDWANFLFYILVFFLGFIMVSDNRIMQAAKRHSWVALGALAVCIFIIVMIDNEVFGPESLKNVFWPLGTWLALLAWIGFAMRWLNFSNGLLTYANNAVLPVYILHQTMIISIGYFVIQWDWPVAGKYPFIVASVFVSSLLIYEIVRRIGVTRFLFGIKARAAKKLIGKN
jgi:glucans biosynthesis protein C